MKEKNELNNLFDRGGVDDLDKKIKERLARPTLVKEMRKKNKSINKDKMSFENELREYWWVYVLLAASGLFTMTLGVYMGLSPTRQGESIFYHTDPMHLFLAFVYAVVFFIVTEGAFAVGKRIFFMREKDNTTQKWTALAIMVIAGLSILGTGIAGGFVIASQIDFLTEFVEVPKAAQRWVIVAIPALITVYSFLGVAYHLSSDEAESERTAKDQERALELDNRVRRRAVNQIVNEELEVAEIKSFIAMIEQGKMTAAEARARIRAGRALAFASDTEREELSKNAPSQ